MSQQMPPIITIFSSGTRPSSEFQYFANIAAKINSKSAQVDTFVSITSIINSEICVNHKLSLETNMPVNSHTPWIYQCYYNTKVLSDLSNRNVLKKLHVTSITNVCFSKISKT